MTKILRLIFRNHLCYGAAFFAVTTVVAFYLILAGSLAIAWIATFVLPVLIGAVLHPFSHRNSDDRTLGTVLSYEIRNAHLYLTLGGVIPVYKASLGAITHIDHWRHLGAFGVGSSENSWFYILKGIWFWPFPWPFVLKKYFSAAAVRFEYVLKLSSGLIIVIGANPAFMNALRSAVKEANQRIEPAGAPPTPECDKE